MIKKCGRCKEPKALVEFGKVYSTKTGLNRLCKEFAREQQKGYRENLIRNTCIVARKRANRVGLAFDLTDKYLSDLLESQDKACAITKMPFSDHRAVAPGQGLQCEALKDPYRPSLDRVNPSLGYTEGNVRFVLWGVNAGMGSWGLEVYKKIARAALEESHKRFAPAGPCSVSATTVFEPSRHSSPCGFPENICTLSP